MRFRVGQLVRIKKMSGKHCGKYGPSGHVGCQGKIVEVSEGSNNYPYRVTFKKDNEWMENCRIEFMECELESIIKKGQQLVFPFAEGGDYDI